MSKRLSAAVAGAAVLAWAATASADGWDEQTTLKFSEAVIVPGATLQPGTYEFELLDSSTNRNIVQIRREDGTIVTTTQAVPTKRVDSTGEVVLRFNPTDEGTPPALKAWFYPGSLYGHEFIYPDEQAREIAERTKSIVLSTDVPESDMEKGTLRTYDPAGQRAEWKADDATMREWADFHRQWRAGGANAEARRSTAPVVQGDFRGMRVSLSDLEENPSKYTGKTISTDGEVEEVFGPRFFSIDEQRWGDLDGEILVLMPAGTAATVREDDRVTVTGTLRPFVRAEFEREWGWLGLDPAIEIELGRKPVLVADRLVGGNNDVAMIIATGGAPAARAKRPVGTSGTAAADANAGPNLRNLAAIAGGDERLVGRHVKLEGVRVAGTADKGGFFVRGADERVFVLPAEKADVSDGKTVSIEGVVLQMPSDMDDRLATGGDLNGEIYVYATSVS